MLRPFSNLLAYASLDHGMVDAMAASLAKSGAFQELWRPNRGWVVALAPLPDSEPEPEGTRRNGFAFVEGHADLMHAMGMATAENLATLSRIVCRMPRALGRFPGDFGFLHISDERAASVVRAAVGVVPFYVWQAREQLAVFTRLSMHTRYIQRVAALDAFVCALWASNIFVFPDQRTFLRGVRLIEHGTVTHLSLAKSFATVSYWSPRRATLDSTGRNAAEHASRFRNILLGNLRKDLDRQGRNLLALSGGIDSCALAALTGGILETRFSAVSLLPADERARRRDLSFIAPLERRYGFQRTEIPFTAESVLANLRQLPPQAFYIPHAVLASLPVIARSRSIAVYFGGEFADQVAGQQWTLRDWARHTTALELIRHAPEIPFGLRTIRPWAGIRYRDWRRRPDLPWSPDLARYVHAAFLPEYMEWRARQQRALACDDLPRADLWLQVWSSEFATMNWELTSELGIRRSFPFYSRDMLELAFELHPRELIGPGSKKILQRALHGLVPSLNLYRRDKGATALFSQQRVRCPEARNPQLAEVLSPEYFQRHDVHAPVALHVLALTNIVRASCIQSDRGHGGSRENP